MDAALTSKMQMLEAELSAGRQQKAEDGVNTRALFALQQEVGEVNRSPGLHKKGSCHLMAHTVPRAGTR